MVTQFILIQHLTTLFIKKKYYLSHSHQISSYILDIRSKSSRDWLIKNHHVLTHQSCDLEMMQLALIRHVVNHMIIFNGRSKWNDQSYKENIKCSINVVKN